mmetsp:Transcript_41636/g.102592  ORF Transcript_41636/g.102592 Transcript_41636/m.102592 type:complete len:115 (-) Transcript_41636:606-950(-)
MIDVFLAEHEKGTTEGITIVDICGGVATGLLAAWRASHIVSHYYLVESDHIARAMAATHMERLLKRYPNQMTRATIVDALSELPGNLEEVTTRMWRSIGKVDHINAAWPGQGLS